MCWCPITNLDTADSAYEWNMGQYVRNSNSFTGALSNDLAESYATYINQLNLKDPNGNALKLEKSNDGIYTSGSYYDYMLTVTEESLNNFLNDTTFPYSPSSNRMGSMPSGGAPSGEMPTGSAPSGESGETPTGSAPSGEMQSENTDTESSKSYQTAQDYID